MFYKRKIYILPHASSTSESPEDVSSRNNVEMLDELQNKKCTCNPFLGFFYTLVTSFLVNLSAFFMKRTVNVSTGEFSMIRNIGVWAGCLPIAIYSSEDIVPSRKNAVILTIRSFTVATAMYLNLTAFRNLRLTEAAAVISSLPAVTTLLARLYLKELCSLVQGFALIVTFCGVLLAIRLPELVSEGNTEMDSTHIGGLAAAVGCVLTLSVGLVILRKMKNIHFSIQQLYVGIIGMLETGVINAVASEFTAPYCGWDMISTILIGIFGFIGHCTMTLAVQNETVGTFIVMKASLDMVFAMFFQILFFDVKPDIFNISGAILVIVSTSMIGFTKWLSTLPLQSAVRKKFKYFLM